MLPLVYYNLFFLQAEDGIRDSSVTGVQTCALPIFPDQLLGMTSRHRDPEGLRRKAWQMYEPGKLLVFISISDPVIHNFFVTAPLHDGAEVNSGRVFPQTPRRERYRDQCSQPVTACFGDRAIGGIYPLPDRKQPFAAIHGVYQEVIAADQSKLGKAGIQVDVNMPSGPIIFFPPDVKGRCKHDQEIRLGADGPECIDRHSNGTVPGTVDPSTLKADWPEAVPHICSGVIQFCSHLLGVPAVDPCLLA